MRTCGASPSRVLRDQLGTLGQLQSGIAVPVRDGRFPVEAGRCRWLFAYAGPGTASYDNLVVDNYIAGNELSGVTMHAHTLGPGQFEDLSGNRIVHNTIGKNNNGGDPLDGTAKDPSTTGILVFSGTVPVTVTIAHNRIRNNQYGVWLGVRGHVTATLKHNVFQHVTTPVFTSP